MEYIIKNTSIVNEGTIIHGDVWIKNNRIRKIAPEIHVPHTVTEIDGEGKHLLPGVIDDQVHFQRAGLTHKATFIPKQKLPLQAA